MPFNEQNAVEDYIRDLLARGTAASIRWEVCDGKNLKRAEEEGAWRAATRTRP